MSIEIIKHIDDGKYHLRTRPGFTACCKLIVQGCERNAKPPTTLDKCNEAVLCRTCWEKTKEIYNINNDVCTLPPPGWHCTREYGHEGPCAAVPTNNKMNTDFVEILHRLHILFPINRNGTSFKGTHHLIINDDGDPELRIWIRTAHNRFRMIHITCDPEDFNKTDAQAWAEIRRLVEQEIEDIANEHQESNNID